MSYIGGSEVETVFWTLHADPGADDVFGVMRAPVGLTIRRMTAVSSAAHGAGTAYTLRLVNYGTTGTVSGGTLASLGGTAAAVRFAADTPQTTTTITRAYVAPGEYLMMEYDETGDYVAGRMAVQIDYVIGRGSEATN